MTSSQNSTTTNSFVASHRNTLAQLQGTTYGQSFSGSETDVSTSTENLSPEERYALEYTQRQEPQGQENVGSSMPGMAGTQSTRVSALVTSGVSTATTARSNESNASISSSTNTLIIHSSQADDSWSHRWLPGGYSTPVSTRKSTSSNLSSVQDTINFTSSIISSPSLLDSTLTQKSSVPSYLSDTGISSSPKLSGRSSALKFHAATDLPDIPSSYLDQSEVLKHLLNRNSKEGQKDQKASSSSSELDTLGNVGTSKNISQLPLLGNLDTTVNYANYPLPPAYTMWHLDDADKLENVDLNKSSLSRSQPDLSKLANSKDNTSPKELLSQRIVSGQMDSSESHLLEMADILAQENNALKMEVDMYHRKVAKLQRFEMEIIKVHEAHEALVKLSERREQLERLARHKLHAEVKRLTDLNADLKDQVDLLSTQVANQSLPSDSADALRKELNKRDVFIAQLVSQNKELIAAKERQEIELTAQRQTLNEQRTHIDILDSALTNAQANVVKLEEELRKKQNLVEQAGQLKRLLVSLQLAADRREQSEKNLRTRLEKEIEQLRMGFKQEGPDSKLSDLRREIREKEEKIMLLEGEVTKWEQRYLQESAMRQLAIEAASMPKDAKIAALEKTSQESERRIAQAKSDKIRHMDEIHNMNKKQAEYEGRNRELETQIAERNAMIRVLQKRLEEKEAVLQNALVRNSLGASKGMEVGSSSSSTSLIQSHSTQASSAHSYTSSGGVGGTGASSTAPSTPRRDEELDRRLRAENYGGSRRSTATLADLNSLSSDDLLVDNEEGVLGKLGVVYFPGLAHPGLAEGEGTLSKSLLACVESQRSSSSSSSFISSSRHTNDDLPLLGFGASGIDPPSMVHDQQLQGPLIESLPTYAKTMGQVLNYQRRELSSSNAQQQQQQPLPRLQYPEASSSSSSSSSTLHSVDHHKYEPPPPPYHGRHELLLQQQVSASTLLQSHPTLQLPVEQDAILPASPPMSPNLTKEAPLPRPPMCRNPHHPTVACRKCNSVRSSNRQNAAILVRRANSSGGQIYRNSAPLPGCQTLLDTDDAPSILARLRREWHLGNIPPKGKNMSQTSQATNVDKTSEIQMNVGKDQSPQNETNRSSLNDSLQQSQHNTQQGNKVGLSGSLLPLDNRSDDNRLLPDVNDQRNYVRENSPLNFVNLQNSQSMTSTEKLSEQEIVNVDKVNRNNDHNQQNCQDKMELIILEDSDQLKAPQNYNNNSNKSVQDVG